MCRGRELRKSKFRWEICKETLKVAKQRRGGTGWGGREKQETERGSSCSLVSLMKGFEFCLVEGGAVGGSLFADKFSAQID